MARSEIIEAAGGKEIVAPETNRTVDAIYKWPENGIPDRHWASVIKLTGGKVTAADIYAANEQARTAKAEAAA